MKKNNISGFVGLVLLMPALILGLSGPASAAGYDPIYDLIEDGYINNKDLGAFVDEWLNDCNSVNNWCNGANFNNDNNMVDFDDYTLFATYYLADANLLGYWMFDEGSDNTAYDSSGNGNDGNLVGNPTWATGHIGGALSFDGDGDYVDCGSDSSLNITDEITIAAWVKVSELAIWQGLVSKWITGDRSYGLFIDGNKKFAFYLTSTGSAPISMVASNSVPNVGSWYHVIGVRRANTMYLYIDSVEQTDTSGFTGSIWTSATFLEIGAYEEGASSFNGAIDDVRIYDRGFDAAEVSQLYQHGLGYKAFNPNPCDEATGVDENNVVLSWSPGKDAPSHDVYLGTDYNDVNDANNSWPVATGPDDPNVYKGNQGPNSYDPCGLESDIIYYWRIDEVNGTDIYKGNVWNFYTGPLTLRIQPTEAALRAALAQVAALLEGGTIKFDCPNDTDIDIYDEIYFDGNNMTLDGENKNITFLYTGPDECTQEEGQDCFIEIHGNDNVIRNFVFGRTLDNGFPDGLHIQEGYRNIVEDCNFLVICEDAVSNNGLGYEAFDTIIRNCYFDHTLVRADVSRDKAIMINDGGSVTVQDCNFWYCRQPVRATGSSGYYIIKGNNFDGPMDASTGPRFSGGSSGQVVIFENNTVNHSQYGIRVYGSVQAIIKNNTFINGEDYAVYVYDSAKVRLQDNYINNFERDGVRIMESAQADLGGGSVNIDGDSTSSTGGNTITGNGWGGSYYYDVNNMTGSMVMAENNFWDYNNVSDVQLYDVNGLVDVDPLGTP